jgi:broad specificity phosphatase PhoE
MKTFALVVSIMLSAAVLADAAPFIFVVRHAEKATSGGNDPDLSESGHKRAEALARVLKDSQITAIFVTEFKRTQQTAAPTANAAHVKPTVVQSTDSAGLVDKLRGLEGNALVVGHGNTIPALIKALGIDAAVSVADNDYTEIFVLTLGDSRRLLRLHYPF